ncbi:unnamed protein product [Amoebophrya sp. A120]|nr:unnamed protein product [Amoebophrya sp. A120]|eukprot:GSA120T00004305001.1
MLAVPVPNFALDEVHHKDEPKKPRGKKKPKRMTNTRKKGGATNTHADNGAECDGVPAAPPDDRSASSCPASSEKKKAKRESQNLRSKADRKAHFENFVEERARRTGENWSKYNKKKEEAEADEVLGGFMDQGKQEKDDEELLTVLAEIGGLMSLDSPESRKKEFRRLQLKYHPDKNIGREPDEQRRAAKCFLMLMKTSSQFWEAQ